MARQRSPDRDKAFEIYRASNGKKPLVEIAKRSVTNVKKLKTKAKLKKMIDDEELAEQERLLKYFNGTQDGLEVGYAKSSVNSCLLRRVRVAL